MKTSKILSKTKILFISLTILCMLFSTIPVAAATGLNKKTASIYVNSTVTLKVAGTSKKAKWSSSNPKIAAVNNKGIVKGKKVGNTKVIATIGKKKYVCKIMVKNKPRLNCTTKASIEGKSFTLKMLYTSKKVTWSSSNKKLAIVSSKGKVTCKKKGIAYIYARIGKNKYKCTVRISAKKTISNGEALFTDGANSKPEKNPILRYKIKSVAPKADKKLLDAFDALGFKLKYKEMTGWVLGLTSTYEGDKSITINPLVMQKTFVNYDGKTSFETVIYHELGHFVAWLTDRADLTDEFRKIAKEECKVNDYIGGRAEEYFADSYKRWVLQRNVLKIKYPKTYAYIKKQIDYINKTPLSYWVNGNY